MLGNSGIDVARAVGHHIVLSHLREGGRGVSRGPHQRHAHRHALPRPSDPARRHDLVHSVLGHAPVGRPLAACIAASEIQGNWYKSPDLRADLCNMLVVYALFVCLCWWGGGILR